jgi:urea transporter
MACALQALALNIMMAWHICREPSNCMNDGIAYALQALELHVMRAWHMPTQSTGVHVMRTWYMSWRPQGLGHIEHIRLRSQYKKN